MVPFWSEETERRLVTTPSGGFTSAFSFSFSFVFNFSFDFSLAFGSLKCSFLAGITGETPDVALPALSLVVTIFAGLTTT